MRATTRLGRRLVALAAVAALAASFGSPAATAASAPIHLGSVAPGGRLDATPIFAPGPSGHWQYTFDITGRGSVLRVGVDMSQRDTCFAYTLTDPSGVQVNPAWQDWPYVCTGVDTGQSFDTEVSAWRPAQGRWTVTVDALNVDDLAFRLRVVLEQKAREPKELLPNLVPWTPWEFGFVAPASDHPGTANDTQNTPGDPTVACHPEDEPGAIDCLRFSAGVYNTGAGPMYIQFLGDDAYQHVYSRDSTPGYYVDNEAKGRFTSTWAGSGEWHPFHEHRHLSDFVLYELLAVDDIDAGAMTAVGTGDKHGYCTFSQQVRDWGLGSQDHQYSSYAATGDFCRDFMTLERGWGDIYRWQRPGQYVTYESIAEPDGTMPAGLYVLRSTVDPLDNIRETDETDNTGYALLRVVDGGGPGLDSVIECEQGLGDSPWDPAKVVIDDRLEWAKVAANPGYTPPSCD